MPRPGPAYSMDSDLEWKFPPGGFESNYYPQNNTMDYQGQQMNPMMNMVQMQNQGYDQAYAMNQQPNYAPNQSGYSKRPPSISDSLADQELEPDERDTGDDPNGNIRVVIRYVPLFYFAFIFIAFGPLINWKSGMDITKLLNVIQTIDLLELLDPTDGHDR